MVMIWSYSMPGRPMRWNRPWGFQLSRAAHSSSSDDSSATIDSTVEMALQDEEGERGVRPAGEEPREKERGGDARPVSAPGGERRPSESARATAAWRASVPERLEVPLLGLLAGVDVVVGDGDQGAVVEHGDEHQEQHLGGKNERG